MTDKLQEQQYRGDEAKRLLEHPLIKEFFDLAEKAVIQTWIESEVGDEQGQRMCKLALRAQQNLRQQFERCIANGAIAANELMQKRDPTKPIRR